MKKLICFIFFDRNMKGCKYKYKYWGLKYLYYYLSIKCKYEYKYTWLLQEQGFTSLTKQWCIATYTNFNFAFFRNIMDVSILSLRFNRNCFNIKLNTLSTGALDAGTLTTLNAGLSRTVLLHSKRPNNQLHQSHHGLWYSTRLSLVMIRCSVSQKIVYSSDQIA